MDCCSAMGYMVFFLFLFTQCIFGVTQEPQTGAGTKAEMVGSVRYCSDNPEPIRNARVQVLLDHSGSMNGFYKVVPVLQEWLAHSISQMRGFNFQMGEARVCFFSRAIGIKPVARWNEPLPSFSPQGYTNLHEAIKASIDYDLTFILTDGVAATERGDTGDCAQGVDAACVAQALRSAVVSPPADNRAIDRGIWIVPLVTAFDGKFYTEEVIAKSDFDPSRTEAAIRQDLAQQPIAIKSPTNIRDNTLMYNYQGPRTLMLIVIARLATLGRATMQALVEQASYRNFSCIQAIREFKGNIAYFKPIELYPGYFPPVEFENRIKESPNPKDIRGTIDVRLTAQGKTKIIKLTCPADEFGEGIYYLMKKSPSSSAVSGCVDIVMMPAMSFAFQAQNPNEEGRLRQILKEYKPFVSQKAGNGIMLHLYCSAKTAAPCRSNRYIKMQWAAFLDYRRSADLLRSPSGQGVNASVIALLQSLSTFHPSIQPHRIYGFLPILTHFLFEVGGWKKTYPLSEFILCTE